jgi:hypothetical protein
MLNPHTKFKSHKTLTNRHNFLHQEQTGLHICAKRTCDRSCIFEIIDQKACRSYGEQDSSNYQVFNVSIRWRSWLIYPVYQSFTHTALACIILTSGVLRDNR